MKAHTEQKPLARYNTARLKEIPISQVVQRVATVKRQGSTYRSLCPWHEDTHPSLVTYEKDGENRCYCFACRKGGTTIDYIMAHENLQFTEACQWLSQEFGISMEESSQSARLPRRPVRPNITHETAKPEYSYIPMSYLQDLVSVNNSFSKCLCTIYGPHTAEHLTEEYMLGAYEDAWNSDNTLFPSIDQQMRVCYIKKQCYETDIASERFAHYKPKSIMMMGPLLSKQGILPAEAKLNYNCLFGAHLLSKYPNADVFLTESPKNALIMAAEHPEYVCLATGSKSNLKRESLECLKGRNVFVVPDCDAIDDWKNTIEANRDLANFVVSDFCQRMAPEGQDKYDIADYYLSLRMPKPEVPDLRIT